MRFKDLKIGTKIMTGFAVVALITLAVGVIGYTGLSRVAKSFHDVADVRMPSIEYLKEMEIGYENYRVAQRTLLNPNLGAEDKARQFQNIAKARERYTKAMEMFEPLEQTQEEAILWKEFKETLAQWRNTNLEFEKEIDNLTQIDIFYPMQFLKDLQTFKGDHYLLQVNIANTIRSSKTFDGGDDHTACRLGRWLPTITTQNPTVVRALNDLNEPHQKFHQAVHDIKRLVNSGNRDQAWRIYETVMIPSAEGVFRNFEVAINEAERAVGLFEKAEKINLNNARLAQNEALSVLRKVIGINEHEAALAIKTGDQDVNTSDAMILGGIIVGLILALSLGLLITRMISAPLIKGVGFAQTIAEGDLTAELENEIIDRKDEVGQLGGAMQNMVDKLKEVISSVMMGSDNIAAASMQMSSGSQQVSQGASEQASSAEEVSSSMEEMAANIQQNTDNAQEADKISQKVQDGVSKVGSASQDSLISIKNIAEKINIINDIAFQTNILALNAAVEAARAGEQGRGFAVVAAEVRKLAERSKIAADEIVALASKSVNVTENASELMTGLIPEIEKTAKLVQEIAAASMEQSSGSDQVNTAIQQLNQVTQQNAAASEEMATSAEELSSQAEQLKEIIGYFKIDNRRITKFQAESHLAPKQAATPSVQPKQQEKPKGVSLKMENSGKANKFQEVTSKAKVTSNDGDFENF
jgi:methyl-accepting chemotaxis protein